MKNQTFLQHLIVFRQTILYVICGFVLSFIFCSIIFYIYKDIIVSQLAFFSGIPTFYSYSVYELFFFPFTLAYYCSLLFIGIPLIGYFIYLMGDKKSYLFLYIVMLLGFFIFIWYKRSLFPLYIKYFILNNQVVFLLSLSAVTNFIIQSIIIWFVAIFLPLIIGILLPNKTSKYKWIYLLFIVVGGLLAPPDPISHIVFSGIMFVLFHLTRVFLNICGYFNSKK